MVSVYSIRPAATGIADEPSGERLRCYPGVDFQRRRERLFGLLVLDQLDTGKEAQPSDVSHHLEGTEGLQPLKEILAHFPRALDQSVLFDVGENCRPDGCRERVLGIGVAVDERPGPLLDGFVDFLRNNHGAERRVAGTQTLGGDDQVRLDLPVIHAEIAATPPAPRHHLVCNEFDVIVIADLPDSGPVSLLGNKSARGGADHRFGDEGGNGVRSFVFNGSLQLLRTLEAALGG